MERVRVGTFVFAHSEGQTINHHKQILGTEKNFRAPKFLHMFCRDSEPYQRDKSMAISG